MNLFICIFLGAVLNGAFAIRCYREPEGIHSRKSVADNKFEIKVHGNPDKYVAGGDYTVSLQGVQRGGYQPTFKQFMLVLQPSHSDNSFNVIGHRNVGTLTLIDDTLSKFSDECPNTIVQTSSSMKSEIKMTWTAPPSDSGCVVFRATVVEDHELWYMDDGSLSLVLCEDIQESDIDNPDEVDKCCACDEALYEMVFRGIWSKHTHPKDFPSNKWETAFSDMIGASHSVEYHFWKYGDFATEGLRQLAELGDTYELENEIKDHAQNVRTIIKARGLRYPNVTSKTYSVFRVDTQKHLMSFVSKIEPSPDWIVGVSGLNLCLKNCSWVQYKIINLYPWDVGSDSGISYNSSNSPTNPQESISRITPSYPNDPDSPFYDATGKETRPLAQLHLMRQQLYEKPCINDISVTEAEPEEILVECTVTNWSKWSQCSESCGKGERFRQRSHYNKRKAHAIGCTEQLTEHEECYGYHPSCREESECEPMEWGPWSECSVMCGIGLETRARRYRTRQEHKHCVDLPDSPDLSESRDCVGVEGETCDEVSQENNDCPQTEWSSWSPCSASCGKGKSIRMLLSVDDEDDDTELSDDCPQVDTVEEQDCFELPSCDINEELYRELCLSPLKEGVCHRNNTRWYFDADTKTCQKFIYRGCYGNRNNFLTQEDCENTCNKESKEIIEEEAEEKEEEEEEEDITEDGPIGGLWPASQIVDPKATYGIDTTISNYIFDTQTEPYTAVDGPVVNCVVGRWTRWSPCSVSCGTGYKTRNRKIVIHPRNGGIACPKVFKKKKCRKSCAPVSEN